MYRIGQFSKFTKITVKALRFYEEEKLLEPCFVDPGSGYRFYESAQLPVAHKIVSLRQCGFSIQDIRQILSGRNLPSLFSDRKKQLEARASETALQLASINHYLENLGKEIPLNHQIVVKELPRVIVYGKRMVVESYDSYFSEIPKIGEEILAANPDLKCVDDPPYCFIMYHDGEYRDHDIDVEYCEAVLKIGRDTETVKFKVIEKVPQAACVLHKGPYSLLWNAYDAVFRWIEDNGFVAVGPPRESYIDGIWNKGKNESQWLTEVQVPLGKV
jgi:DNA-binding transcriptional MerR regulator